MKKLTLCPDYKKDICPKSCKCIGCDKECGDCDYASDPCPLVLEDEILEDEKENNLSRYSYNKLA